MRGKRAQSGEALIMLYRLALVTLIALVVFGISQWSYRYYVDVKQSEAVILSRGVAECLFGAGVLHIDRVSLEEREKILEYCGYGQADLDRLYVSVRVQDASGVEVARLFQGDSGKGWVRKFFEAVGASGSQKKYIPGRDVTSYGIFFEQGNVRGRGTAQVEVIVNNDV